MNTKVTISTKIRVNGVEYASVDSMPADVREAYERAVSRVGPDNRDGAVTVSKTAWNSPAGSLTKIVVNGREYCGVEQMPADVRRVYDGAMATLDAERTAAASGSCPSGVSRQSTTAAFKVQLDPGAARPESANARLIAVGLAIAALLLGSFLFR